MAHQIEQRAGTAAGIDAATGTVLEQALLSGDAPAAERAVHLLLGCGYPLPAVYSGLIQPMMDRLGTRWEHGETSIAAEHLCTATLGDLVARLAATRLWRTHHRGQILLVTPRGERHVIGLMMLQDALTNDGWTVHRPGPLPLAEVPAYLDHLHDVRVIGLSVSDTTRQPDLARDVAALRLAHPRIPVILGGLALRHHPTLWQEVGADGGALDDTSALALVTALTNPLTPREIEVLALASQGRANDDIAIGLGITLSTVKTHLERIYDKIGTHDRAASVATALRRGWMP